MKTRNTTINNLFQYESFVQFFKDWFLEEQSNNPQLSIGKVARKMNLSQAGSVSNILNGRRIPNENTIEKFKDLIELDAKEFNYIDLIVEKDRFKDNAIISDALNLSISRLKNQDQMNLSL